MGWDAMLVLCLSAIAIAQLFFFLTAWTLHDSTASSTSTAAKDLPGCHYPGCPKCAGEGQFFAAKAEA
jgi:hypothetical protein